MPLGCGLVAEDRIRPGPEQGGPQDSLPDGVPGEGDVHAPVQPLPSTAANPGPHGLGVDAYIGTLTPRDGGSLDLKVL